MEISASKRKTKIIATLGPATNNSKSIALLLKSGVNIFRFNMKHSNIEWHEKAIEKVQEVADKLNLTVGILIDLQGPEMRVETLAGEPTLILKDEIIYCATDFIKGKKTLKIPVPKMFKEIKKGERLLIDNGLYRFKIEEVKGVAAKIRSEQNCTILDHKGLNVPGIDVGLPSLIKDDLERLDLATRRRVDFVALSFVRTVADIAILKQEMQNRKIKAAIVSKIENKMALNNLNEIIENSNCIMIARGDLGVETPVEEMVYWQKQIIAKCRLKSKPVIVATEMLLSMVEKPTPTRAEASDVTNAVYDGADALMLSSETASGKYPDIAVSTMASIAFFNEDYSIPLLASDISDQYEIIARAASSIIESSISKASTVKLDAVVVVTETGETARRLSKFRPKIPLFAITPSKKVADILTMSYGVFPIVEDLPKGEVVSLDPLVKVLKKRGDILSGARILFVHGNRWQEAGLTNTLAIKEIV